MFTLFHPFFTRVERRPQENPLVVLYLSDKIPFGVSVGVKVGCGRGRARGRGNEERKNSWATPGTSLVINVKEIVEKSLKSCFII